MDIRIKVLAAILVSSSILSSLGISSSLAAEECTREWALEKMNGKNLKVIGLGLSSQPDPQKANEEAKAAAFKDISLQLQSSVQSRSETTESQSQSNFNANSILTSNTEDLVGLKAIKSGKRDSEKITDCEVYEFNVQTAYEDHASKLSVIEDKINQLIEYGNQKQWLDLIREFPSMKPLMTSHSANIKRADLFKAYVHIPGPGWGERLDKAMSQLSDLDKKARSNIAFVFPKDQFEEAVTEVSDLVTNSGAQVAEGAKDIKPGTLGIQVSIKSMGAPKKSKTKLGLTITRKVAIALRDLKTNRKLSGGNGLSIVGTSANDDADEATTNSDQQLIGAITDAIKNGVPGLIQID